jgi:hypothetical protein
MVVNPLIVIYKIGLESIKFYLGGELNESRKSYICG